VSFSWTAPSGCPTEAELSAQIRSAIGSAAAGHDPVRASAAAEGGGDRWRADVEMSVGSLSSNRWVEGETCRAVADAVVVIVALAVGPAADRPPVTALPSPTVRPAAPPPLVEAPSLARATRAWMVGASLVLDGGTIPSVGCGAELFAAWAPSRLDLELVGSFLAPEQATVTGYPAQGAHVWLAEGRGRACYDVLGGALGIEPCLGGGGQVLVGDGFGSSSPRNATDLIGVASFGGRVVARVSPHVALRLGGEAVVPFTRPTFVIDNAGSVYRSSSAAGRGTIGVELHF
jgi:hypothetical protein